MADPSLGQLLLGKYELPQSDVTAAPGALDDPSGSTSLASVQIPPTGSLPPVNPTQIPEACDAVQEFGTDGHGSPAAECTTPDEGSPLESSYAATARELSSIIDGPNIIPSTEITPLPEEPSPERQSSSPRAETILPLASNQQVQAENGNRNKQNSLLIEQLPIPLDRDPSALTIEQARAIAAHLRIAADTYEEAVGSCQIAIDRLTTRLKDVAALPWLAGEFPTDATHHVPPETKIGQIASRIAEYELSTTRIAQTHEQLVALCDRLGESRRPFVPAGTTDLQQIAGLLEEHAEYIRLRLQETVERERRIAEFCERIAFDDPTGCLRLVESADQHFWSELLLYMFSERVQSDVGQHQLSLRGQYNLAGLIIARAWELDPQGGVSVLGSTLDTIRARVQTRDLLPLIAYLQIDQVASVCDSRTTLVPLLCEILCLVSVTSDSTCLAFLESLLRRYELPPPCSRLYQAMIELWRASGATDVRLQFQQALSLAMGHVTHTGPDAYERIQAMIDQHPGMRGRYYRLRATAQRLFFAKVRAEVEQRNAQAAWGAWRSLGDSDRMAEECVQELCDKEHLIKHDFDRSHITQTKKYIDEFSLLLWESTLAGKLPSSLQFEQVRMASEALSKAEAESENEDVTSLWRTLRSALSDLRTGCKIAARLGHCTLLDSSGGLCIILEEDEIDARMLLSWPVLTRHGSVPLTNVLADRLRETESVGVNATSEAIEYYLARNDFESADSAADDNPSLRQIVIDAFDLQRCHFLDQHQALLVDAKSATDDEIQQILAELFAAIERRNLPEAAQWIEYLQSSFVRYRTRSDPQRVELAKLLAEAGEVVSDDAPLRDLQDSLSRIQEHNASRRLHIATLHGSHDRDGLPLPLRTKCLEIATWLDRPSSWPSDDVSTELSDAIGTILRVFEAKWKYRDRDPQVLGPMGSQLGPWLEKQLKHWKEDTANPESASLRELVELASQMQEHCPDSHILQHLGNVELTANTSQFAADTLSWGGSATATKTTPLARQLSPIQTPARGMDRVSETPVKPDSMKLYSHDLVKEIAETLHLCVLGEPDLDTANAALLQLATREPNWSSARTIAANILKSDGTLINRDGHLSVTALVFAVAAVYEPPTNCPASRSELLRSACLACIQFSPAQYSQYIYGEFVEALPAEALVALVTGKSITPLGTSPEGLATCFDDLLNRPSGDQVYQEVYEMFWRASLIQGPGDVAGSSILANLLWSFLRNQKSAPAASRARSELLQLLFKFRRFESMRDLARTAKPLDDQIIRCLGLFEKAETDAALRQLVYQATAAFREASRSHRNTQPWLFLFNRLGSEQLQRTGSDFSIRIESVSPRLAPPEGLRLDLLLSIDAYFDPPIKLDLEFAGESGGPVSLLTEDELLVSSKLISVDIPSILLAEGESSVVLPFRITGKTLRSKQIDERGRWEVSTKRERLEPLTHFEIKEAWPGAGGGRVRTGRGFHGRQEDVRAIESLLNSNDRPESTILFGERRIGKTSLLLEMVDSYVPSPGRVTGIFVDVAGTPTPPGVGAIRQCLFETIVSAIQSQEYNKKVINSLGPALGSSLKTDRLVREANPQASLADALEVLVDILHRSSGGLINRVAIFLDEFDRYVEPMMLDQKKDVEKMLWDLRKVIQTSQRIGLVLAGSGVQRVFVEGYDQALYGSIRRRELKPFNWESDAKASQSTFLPERLRSRVCRPDKFEEVSQYAHTLTGGNPYFLAILGSMAGYILNGHLWTRAGLDQVVDSIIRGELRPLSAGSSDPPFQVIPDQFYTPIFESLAPLPIRTQCLCKIILAHIAQQTSTNHPWLQKWTAVEPPDATTLTTEDERWSALASLQNVGVLSSDPTRAQVGIRVPLTARALKEHAYDIRQKALRALRNPRH
jgi:hypothetical protein